MKIEELIREVVDLAVKNPGPLADASLLLCRFLGHPGTILNIRVDSWVSAASAEKARREAEDARRDERLAYTHYARMRNGTAVSRLERLLRGVLSRNKVAIAEAKNYLIDRDLADKRMLELGIKPVFAGELPEERQAILEKLAKEIDEADYSFADRSVREWAGELVRDDIHRDAAGLAAVQHLLKLAVQRREYWLRQAEGG